MFAKFDENPAMTLQGGGGGVIKGHNSGTHFQKMMCNNPKLDLVNINAYIKIGENM